MKRNLFISLIILILVVIVVGVVIASRQPAGDTNVQNTPASATTTQSDKSTSTEPSSSQTQAGEVKIAIKDFAFQPSSITVKKGTKVTWTNEDTVKHNAEATSDSPPGGPSGPLLAKGESYSFTFNTVGTFPYLCRPHASQMRGTVVVTE